MLDLRYALRQLVKAPGLTATIVITLALGISACTIVYSTVSTIIFDSWPDDAPERLVLVRTSKPGRPVQPGDRVSFPDFADIQKQAESFEFLEADYGRKTIVTGRGEPTPVSLSNICYVGAPGSSSPALRLTLGRNFLPEEYAPGRNRVVIVSYGFWRNALAGDQNIVGQTIRFDDIPYIIIGVGSREYERYGNFSQGWVPDDQTESNRNRRYYDVHGRLKKGVSLVEAQAEMDLIAHRLADQYPDTNKGYGIVLTPWDEYLNRNYKTALQVLLVAVGSVLLIACANVANLNLVRATVRQREIGLRAALGASRWRIMRQLLTESVVLALAGGGAGLLLAQWGIEAVRSFSGMHTHMARLAAVQIDWRVLVVTTSISVFAGLLAGLAPAWLASRVELNESLKQGTRTAAEAGTRGRLRRALVIFEIAAALVLLTGAGLLLHSFARIMEFDAGINITQTAWILVNRPRESKPDQRRAFAAELLARLRSLPPVEEVAIATGPTPVSNGPTAFEIEGWATTPSTQPVVQHNAVSPGYFPTLGLRLVRGRLFDAHDRADGAPVVIVSDSFARTHFAGQDPLGHRVRLLAASSPTWYEIVGVVSDITPPRMPTLPEFLYFPFEQTPSNAIYAVARITGDPRAALPLMKQQVYSVDRNQPVAEASTVKDARERLVAFDRFTTELLSAFSLIALAIAAVGIYGVMAYSVSQRTTEIGIRMALGASESNLMRQVMHQGMQLVAAGVLCGAVSSVLAVQLIRAQLFQTNTYDPLTLVAVAAVLTLAGLLACWLPARRATKVNPMVALRAE